MPKTMPVTILLLLAGCIGAPDYYELTPYYGTLDLGQRDIDAVDTGLMFTLGWSPKVASHNSRMEDFAMASLAANPRVDPLVLEALQGEAPEEEHIPFLPDVPENEEDRWNILAYGAVALMLAGAAWIFSKRKPKDD